jgi:hypothetical protein
MQHPHKIYYGRSHTKKEANNCKVKLSPDERKRRIVQKKLSKLFPKWKLRIHIKSSRQKGISFPSPFREFDRRADEAVHQNIYQHSISVTRKNDAV